MSARQLSAPDGALMGLLNQLQRRLMAVNHRARYPGASARVDVAGPVAVAAIGAWTTLAEVALGAGRWVLVGGFYSTSQSPGGDAPYIVRSQIVDAAGSSPDYEVGHENTGPSVPAVDCSMPVWSVALAQPSSVSLRAQRSTNLVSCSAYGIYLIAVPG
jgi:hypothetical protein